MDRMKDRVSSFVHFSGTYHWDEKCQSWPRFFEPIRFEPIRVWVITVSKRSQISQRNVHWKATDCPLFILNLVQYSPWKLWATDFLPPRKTSLEICWCIMWPYSWRQGL